MGYLKALPSEMVQTFGSGTGMSGFIDIFSILFLQALGVTKGKVSLNLNLNRHADLPRAGSLRHPLLLLFLLGR